MIAILAFALSLAFAVAQAPAPADLTGTWIGKTEVPNQGDMAVDEVSMVLKKEKAGYSGTISDTLGMIAQGTEIKNIEIKDDAMTFIFPLVDGTVITCRMKIAGDKITGQWEHPEGSAGVLEFSLKK
jgi:Zn/Cd-binding protein ZinT